MSRLAPHLSLPTSDLPQQLDAEGYQFNEDGELVFVEVDVEGEEEKVNRKVGPFLNVADSLVLLQSLRQTRALYLSTLLPLFQTRSKVRAQPSPPPAPHTQIPLGRCTLQIGPCTFPDTRIFEVRYTAPEDVAEARKEADERARSQALEAKKLNPLKAKGTATSSVGTPKPTSNANITPELIAAVNAAAATDPSLQNILTLAAGGKATTAQLQFLGGVINSLQKKGLEKGGAAASPGGTNVASSSTPGKLVATGSPSPAGVAANSPLIGPPFRASGPAGHPGGPPRRPLHPPAPELPLPSPSSYLPSSTHPTLSSTTAASVPGSPSPSKASSSHQASPPPPSNAVASSSSNQPPILLGPRPSRLRIPHDIIIEFEENKPDRFLLPLYRCLLSRDPLVAPSSSSSSHHHHPNTLDRDMNDDEEDTAADPTLLPQSAQSTIRLSFFLPLNQSIVPPTLLNSQTSSSSSKLNPTSSETPTTARPVVRPPRPYIQPSPLPTSQETPENTSIGSGRARAAREKAAATAWDAAEVQRVQAEQAALNLWGEGERKRKEEREEKRKAAVREPSQRRKRGEGEGGEAGGGWPTTVVMDRCSEVVWESVKRNWERYLDVGTGASSTEEGLEMKRREFEELLETVPPRTYLHPRHLPPLPPALIEASSDKYTLKPYVPNIKSVARVEKDSEDGEKRRVSRKRKVDAASAANEEAEAVKEVVVKPKRVRAKRVKKEESAGAGAKTQSPAPPPPPPPTVTAPIPTPTPTPASILAQAHAQPSSSATKRKNYAYVLIDDAPTNQASSSSHPHAHAPSHGITSTSSFWVDEEPSASGGVRRDEFEFVVDQDGGDGDVDMGGEGEGTVEREGKRSRMKPKDWEAEMS